MADYTLSYTAKEIDEKLGKIDELDNKLNNKMDKISTNNSNTGTVNDSCSLNTEEYNECCITEFEAGTYLFIFGGHFTKNANGVRRIVLHSTHLGEFNAGRDRTVCVGGTSTNPTVIQGTYICTLPEKANISIYSYQDSGLTLTHSGFLTWLKLC